MPVHFQRGRRDTRAARLMHLLLGLLNLVLVGMVLYLRFGPYERVITRLEERGMEMPAWFSLLFSAGVLGMCVFLAWRALGSFRRARSGDPDSGWNPPDRP